MRIVITKVVCEMTLIELLFFIFHIFVGWLIFDFLREFFWWPFALIVSIPCLICVLIILYWRILVPDIVCWIRKMIDGHK